MRKRPVSQMELKDTFLSVAPSNAFLEKLDQLVDWKPLEEALGGMYTAQTGRMPEPPLVVFKMLLLSHCYGLSDPQCEELVKDRLSWRRFVGLNLSDSVPDETTLVRFRQRMVAAGLHERMLEMLNEQLLARGLILKQVTLVDATLVAAARRAPNRQNPTGGDSDAGHTTQRGQTHYGYKAHVAVDEQHTLIRRAQLSAANVHDGQYFEAVVQGDERAVSADKAYASQWRNRWLASRGIENGILRRPWRNRPLKAADRRWNRRWSAIRSGIEKVFGHWKRSLGYRRVRYVGRDPNRLELELKCMVWNLKRWVNLARA